MNDITRRAVEIAAKENKKLAERAAASAGLARAVFSDRVLSAWSDEILLTLGVPLKERTLSLFMVYRPDCFEDGFLIDNDLDVMISERVERMIERKIEADDYLQMHDDYIDLLMQIIPVQLAMF